MANERRLIDANALIAQLDKFENPVPNKSGYGFLCGVATVITEIEESPTINAVEVVHGQWVHHYYDSSEPIDDKWYCSKCHMCNDHRRTWYCPNCGAKMDGERRTDG